MRKEVTEKGEEIQKESRERENEERRCRKRREGGKNVLKYYPW